MTIEQKQCLLYYLGYYTGNIDGNWGKGSKGATIAFQDAYGLEPDGVFGSTTEKKILEVIYKNIAPTKVKENKSDDWWDDIEYFDRSEFACKCGKCGGFPVEPKEKLIKVADRVRKNFGKAATVSSGVRCTQHNANVGGVSNSRHLSGKAMDFSVSGVSGSKLLAYVQKQPEIRYAYIIDGNWVHMDIE